MRILEISDQFLALLQIPHATLRRSLHLSVLHFPSAKFGERDPPSGLVCRVGSRHQLNSLASAVQESTLGKVPGSFPSCALTQAAWFFTTDFKEKGGLRVNTKAWS